MIAGLRVALVMPCLNEEDGLRVMLPAAPTVVDEIVIADNGSTDGSRKIAEGHGAKVVTVPQRGYGNACRAGLMAAEADVVVTMDADNTYPMEAIQELVELLVAERLDFITVSREGMNPFRSADAFVRRLGERVLAMALSVSCGVMLTDSQSGMWVIRKSVLPLILPETSSMAFSQEIKVRAMLHPGVKAREVTAPFPDNTRPGESKLRLIEDGFGNLRRALELGARLKKEAGHAGGGSSAKPV